MGPSTIQFFLDNLDVKETKGKRILEVGSKDVNGGVRTFFERFCYPREYLGIDILKGKGVDRVVSADQLIKIFGKNSFDMVINTDMLEHAKDWKSAVHNMKNVLKEKGIIYVVVPSRGFGYHFLFDYWRFELDDIKKIFGDFDIIKIEKRPDCDGVLLKAKKPRNFKEKDLSDYPLYSIILNRKSNDVVETEDMPLLRKIKIFGSDKVFDHIVTIYEKLRSGLRK